MKVALCALKRPREVLDEAAVKGNRGQKSPHTSILLQQLQLNSLILTLCYIPYFFFPQNASFRLNTLSTTAKCQRSPVLLFCVFFSFFHHPLIFHLHVYTSHSDILHPHTFDVTANKWSVLTVSGAVIPSTHSSISFPALACYGIRPHPLSLLHHLFTPGPYISHC